MAAALGINAQDTCTDVQFPTPDRHTTNWAGTLKSGLTEIKVQPLPMLTWPYSHVLHTTADSTSVYCRCSIGQCAHVEEPKCVANLPVSQGWHVVAPGRIGFYESQDMQSSRVKRVKG